MTSIIPWKMAVLASALVLSACGGGGGGGSDASAVDSTPPVTTVDDTPPVTPSNGCTGDCANATTKLSVAEVQQVLAQAVAEADALNVNATMAVVDRVGRVLAVLQTNNLSATESFVTITSTAESGGPVVGGLEGVNIIPGTLAAISKAITAAYVTSEGNAFTTRTASQIIQENFNPGEGNTPSGPLFGVQFSQLPCSDFSQRFVTGSLPGPGPMRAPLGMSADSGGIPLYKAGTPVGAIGVIADGIYSLDKEIFGFDVNPIDELIATAGTVGLAAPLDRRADAITIVGKTARFADVQISNLLTVPADARSFANITTSGGYSLVPVPGYYDGGTVVAGTAFGQAESGIAPADPSIFVDEDGISLDAFLFVNADGSNRFTAKPGTEATSTTFSPLTTTEVQTILNQAIDVANSARAQIRQPDGTQARVSVSVVDTNGVILAMGRTRDAPIFGADVSLQKARTATFFSSTARDPANGPAPADVLRGLPAPIYLGALDLTGDLVAQLAAEAANDPGQPAARLAFPQPELGDYIDFNNQVDADNPERGSAIGLQQFFFDGGIPNDVAFKALEADGTPAAFADRSGGNLSRPTFPDGPEGGPPGPFSKPSGQWSIFNVGLQLDLVYNDIINHVAFVLLPDAVPDVAQGCTGNTGLQNPLLADPAATPAALGSFTLQNKATGLGNGIQIFPGSVPIYRGDTLVGGIGVSGDGVDQDDMISFLGLHRAGLLLESGIGNAPIEIRANNLEIFETRLRYVNCPQVPFIGSNDTEVCNGL